MEIKIIITDENERSHMPRKDTLRRYHKDSSLTDDDLLSIAGWLKEHLDQKFVLPDNHMLKCLIKYEENRRK